MAIQQIDLKVPGGDTPRSANTKINANFTTTTHAASKLVGKGQNDIPDGKIALESAFLNSIKTTDDSVSENDLPVGSYKFAGLRGILTLPMHKSSDISTAARKQIRHAYPAEATNQHNREHTRIKFWGKDGSEAWSPWVMTWTEATATRDSNGFLKASSPILRVFSDKIESNNDAEGLNAVFVKNGVGDYTIKNTTGLANEGWYIELPQDANKNPLVAVEYEDLGNGEISLKTYKRTFDMVTFMFAPDKNNPMDIPETRWIDLRFNDLPQETPTDLDKTNP